MITAPAPSNEAARLEALREYRVLDTPPEQAFDDLTHLVAAICGTPIALVSLVDAERQWFKSRFGLQACETSRDVAFCSHAILEPDNLLIVRDALEDPRFADNPLVTEAPHVRFYAGAPLVNPIGIALGTLCVIDHNPRDLEPSQLRALGTLARHVVTQLELRKACIELHALSARLQSTNTELERRRKEVESFYHTLAHELRTPLTATREFVSILLDGIGGPLHATQTEYLTIARHGCDQLALHIDDLLDMSRLDTGKLAITKRVESLVRVAAEAVACLESRAREQDVHLTCTAGADLPLVSIDPARMQQVVTNLLTNAIKFTPAGGEIRVRVYRDPERPEAVALDVSDTGIGMDPQHLDHIFDRLYQVDRDDAYTRGGLGIGLSICREIIRLHGGDIHVASKRGRGTTFSFWIPVPAPAMDASIRPEEEVT